MSDYKKGKTQKRSETLLIEQLSNEEEKELSIQELKKKLIETEIERNEWKKKFEASQEQLAQLKLESKIEIPPKN